MAGMLGMSLLVLTACESTTGKTTGQTINDATDDATITASVQGKLLTDDKLSNSSRINVDTDGSVVTLKGTVRSIEEKRRAEDLAQQVAGVTRVDNNLSIKSITMGNPANP
jgi:osmotically-inducible protein OsmY